MFVMRHPMQPKNPSNQSGGSWTLPKHGACNCGRPQWSVGPIPCPVHGYPTLRPPRRCPCECPDPHNTNRIYVSATSTTSA